jgi:hypothetical protein
MEAELTNHICEGDCKIFPLVSPGNVLQRKVRNLEHPIVCYVSEQYSQKRLAVSLGGPYIMDNCDLRFN